jgi:hypothetical protein
MGASSEAPQLLNVFPRRRRSSPGKRNTIIIGCSGKRLLSIAAQRADSIGIGFNVWRKEVIEVKSEDIVQKIAWAKALLSDRKKRVWV